MKKKVWAALLGMSALLVACTSPAPRTSAPAASSPKPLAQRTLEVAIRLEPTSLLLRPPRETFFFVDYLMIFNADIAAVDDHGVRHPYLVDSFPLRRPP